MKVLVLCYEYPPIGGGGGRVARTVAEAFVQRGIGVRVQTAGLGIRSMHETINGVEIFRTASLRRAPENCRVHEMGLYCATSLLPTLRHVRDWKPDVIHAHFAMPTGLLAWTVHRATKVPYVLTAHLGDVPGGVPEQTDRLFRLIGPFARNVWHEAAGVTAVSTFVQMLAEAAYGRKVERVLNGIDLRDAVAPHPPRALRHLVFAGRLNPQKCPVFLIDALAGVATRNWRLTLIGDGPLMPDVRERIARHGLIDKVTLTGWLDTPSVERILRDGDVFVLPSSSEGLPVAAIEALKHGLAVASSEIPGTLDVVDDGVNGRRLPMGDLAAWQTGLTAMLSDSGKLDAMKQASFAKARDFELEHSVVQYEAILRQAAKTS